MTRNCLNVMRKVADANPGAMAAAPLRRAFKAQRDTARPDMPLPSVGGGLRWLYNNPEEATNNFQAALGRRAAQRQKGLEYLYNWGGKKLAPAVNREAGHVATRVVPALGQAGGHLVDATRDNYNAVADFADRVGSGWGGKLAENLGRHASTAADILDNAEGKWDVRGLDKAVDRGVKSFDKLGRTLLNRFQRGGTR